MKTQKHRLNGAYTSEDGVNLASLLGCLMVTGALCTILAAGAEAFSISLVEKVIDQGFIGGNMDILYTNGLQIVAIYLVKVA